MKKFFIVFFQFATAWEYANLTYFQDAIQTDKITFVNFGTQWCGHCKSLKETWEELKIETAGIQQLLLLAIDCDDLESLCKSKEAETYPTLIAFQNGEEIQRYPSQASRSKTSLKAAIQQYVDDYSMPELVESNGIMFYPVKGYFIRGDRLMDDFWVGEVKDDEVACRNACVDKIPDCHAYSVKVEDPMKGQCYLKTEAQIENNNEYDMVKAPSYNSGRIGAQQFDHCWSNVYGKKSVYDPFMPKQTSGCWSHNKKTGKCEITNSDCIDIECSNTKMTGFIRGDVFHDNTLVDNDGNILRKVLFNRKELENCQQKITYNKDTNRFQFEIELGTCAMLTTAHTYNGNGYIHFSQELSFEDPPKNEFGIFLAGFYTGSVGFNCYYRSTTSGSKDFKVVTRIFNGQIEKYVNWDYTSELSFYADDTFSEPILPTSLSIGFPVYFSSSWDVNFVSGFPVRFYADKCSVISQKTNNEYAIIKGGCGSILANTHLYSESPYQPYRTNYSFRSFSFSQGQSTYDLSLVCTIHFCLKADIAKGTCGFNVTSCPDGYTPLVPKTKH